MTTPHYLTDNLGSDYLNKLWDVSNEAKVLCDTNRQILLANTAFCKLFLYSFEECIGQDIDQLITPAIFLPESDTILEMIVSDIPVSLDTLKTTKEGNLISLFQIAFCTNTDSNDEVLCYIFKNLPLNLRRMHDPQKNETIIINNFEDSCEPSIYSDIFGNIIKANPAFIHEFGWTKEELTNQNISALMIPPTIKPESEYINAMQKTGQILRLNTVRKTKSNKSIRISLISSPAISPIHKGDGYRIYRTASSKTETKAKIEINNYFNSHHTIAHKNSMIFATTINSNRTIEFVSQVANGLAGYNASFLLSEEKNFSNLILEDDLKMVLDTIKTSLETQSEFNISYRIKSHSGKVLWVIEHGKTQLAFGDQPGFCISSITDISELKEEDQSSSKIRIAMLHEYATKLQQCRSIGEIYRTCTKAGEILLNGACNSIFVQDNAEMKQVTSIGKIEHGCNSKCVLEMAEVALNTVSPCFFRSKDVKDKFCPAGSSGVSYRLNSNAVFQIVFKDNTVFGKTENRIIELLLGYTKQGLKRITLKQQLIKQALHDTLTGIYNRNYFNRVIELEEHRAKRLGTAIGFIMIDVDNFKAVNDAFGHQRGDMVLKEIAQLISGALRKTDTALRYGGDEFLVILTRMATDNCGIIEYRIKKAISHSRLLLMPDSSRVTVSMGHAFWTPKAKETIDEVLRIADRIMYINKKKKTKKQ